ncbi:MAG: FliG C-terminal domain-containing protein [Planctomycetota bacterium]
MSKSPLPPSNVDKAAILLQRLAPQSLAKVLEMVGPEHSKRLRSAIDNVSKRSDYGELTEQVLQEFRELQQDVRASIGNSPMLQRVRSEGRVAAESARNSGHSHREAPPESTGSPSGSAVAASFSDSMQELLNTPPAVLAAALQRETPRVMALVLKQLPTDVAGGVLEQFAGEQRQQVFVLLAGTSQVHPEVARGVLRTIAAVCRTIDPTVVGQQDGRFRTLVGILQKVVREERIRLMEVLAEHDPELAAQIENVLYDFTDIMRIEDRSVQKLLSQLEQKVVALALKTAPEDLSEKVMRNLSERVRGMLTEEMELLGTVPNSKAEPARKEIADAIRAQDKEGTLVWME